MKLEVQRWEGTTPPTEAELRTRLERDGYQVMAWTDSAAASYEPHQHEHDESLWITRGEMTFGVGAQEYRLGPGDRLMLPRGTVHTAVTGSAGASYLIGQRG